ncbi:hypothetical protein [Umezawaea sp. Da 62-37]|uniref:hypothetical protein n=1 Tax=Umezawaea sp. Da 62-37 TaxID=3075927 RepID=UPI0028F6E004|nr:hypothetical protein [Umezawaea sp. Da 62-37]WNV91121.1 hypothetical protein RM788_23430 [Umezawaea sp. Da 62-37]
MLPSRLLLVLALAIHLLYAALPLPLLPTEKSNMLIPAVLAVAPLFGLAWFGARHRYRPQHWAAVSLCAAVVQSFGVMVAIIVLLRPTELHPALNLLIYLLLWLPPSVCAWLACKALAAAPPAVIGGTRHHIGFPIRAVQKSLWSNDSVVVTDEAVEIWLAEGGSETRGRGPWRTVPLNEITGVGIRAAVPNEEPWAVPRDRPGQSVPAGDVVVVRTAAEDRVLPIGHSRRFVELLRARTGRALPSQVEQARVVLGTHVPEVLPAPDPIGPKVYATRGPDEPLPTGPGLTTRWLIAVPLALAGVAGLPLALLLTTSAPVSFLAWIGVAVVVWLCNLRVPRVWGRVAFVPVPMTLFWLAGNKHWLLALALVLCPVLGRLAGAVFTKWRGTDLGASAVEVPFHSKNGERLFVQRDTAVLHMSGGQEVLPYTVSLADVELAQTGVHSGGEKTSWWHSPGGVVTPIWRTPVLRVVAGRQQWLVTLVEARLAAELIRARAATAAPAPADALDLAEWYRLRTWGSAKGRNKLLRVFLGRHGIGGRLVLAAWMGSFAFMLLPFPGARVPGLVTAVLALAALADWARIRPGLRRAERHPLPPDSPDWGETRPDHAPVLGYQPWA